MSDSRILGPIPTPPAQRWREIRLLYLPRVVFLLGVALVAFLWSRSVIPTALVAEAEVVQSEVRSAQAGVIASLQVVSLQSVRAGDVIGQVVAVNPRILETTLAVIRAEVAMLSATMQGSTDRQRMTIEFERLQLESMSHRIVLAGLRVRLQQAQADLARAENLFRLKMITEENFEQARSNRDVLAAQVAEETGMVAHLDPILKIHATPAAIKEGLAPETALASAIKVQEAKLSLAEAQLAPCPLIAPMAGTVSLVLRRVGETVAASEPVVRINSPLSDRLVGYIRHPVPADLKAGSSAEVFTRGNERFSGSSKILMVGTQLEPVSPSILSAMRLPVSPFVELGLRVHLSVPAGMKLRPGEPVDVALR